MSDVHSAAIQVTKWKHVTPPQPAAPATAQAADAEVPPSTVKRRRMALERKLAGDAGDITSTVTDIATVQCQSVCCLLHTLVSTTAPVQLGTAREQSIIRGRHAPLTKRCADMQETLASTHPTACTVTAALSGRHLLQCWRRAPRGR